MYKLEGISILERWYQERVKEMKRKLVIDGNAVYEIDEECMLGKRLDQEKEDKKKKEEEQKRRCSQ